MGCFEEGTEYDDEPVPEEYTIVGAKDYEVLIEDCFKTRSWWSYDEVFPIVRPIDSIDREFIKGSPMLLLSGFTPEVLKNHLKTNSLSYYNKLYMIENHVDVFNWVGRKIAQEMRLDEKV
jgi:hypothetical protein